MTTPRKGSFMNVEIAQRLAEMRREKGFSQEELAARLGLSRQAVSKWERAESSPDTGNLIALADLYGVTLDELVRVDADIADDVTFEVRDRGASAEVEAREAAVAASAAAATAAAAAATAQAAASQGPAAPAVASADPRVAPQAPGAAMPQPVAWAGSHAASEQPVPPPGYAAPVQQPGYGAPVAPAAPAQPQVPYAPASGQVPEAPRRRSPWSTFPYPVLCVIVFLFAGFFYGIWHPAWIVFLTIPLYYWIARIIENDPNYRADHR